MEPPNQVIWQVACWQMGDPSFAQSLTLAKWI
jgi:hypothetical protein